MTNRLSCPRASSWANPWASSFIAALIASAALLLGSCDFSEYCVNCSDPVDASTGDATGDAGQPDAGCPGVDEMCNGVDDDCDGMIDEGTLPEVGDSCGTDEGVCTTGVKECQSGALVCVGAVVPAIEMCNEMDDDCDGIVDNNVSGTGLICGTNIGQCRTGVWECVAGAMICENEIVGSPEMCDALDNDCDGIIDEAVPPGASCGPAQGDTGECMLGQEMCLGGAMQCSGAVYPSAEQCDGIPDTTDRDCDGDPTNGFDLSSDPLNCNGCGIACSGLFMVPDPHVAALLCNVGSCEIGSCQNGYWDLDGVYDNGCEYMCTVQGQEVCNLSDDDCDGVIDEGITPPPNFCSSIGACADPTVLVPICTASGWQCDYTSSRPDVEVDMNGDIVPESLCDDIDNDCDGAVDEGDPNKGGDCNDGNQGICQATGTFECNPADPAAPVVCVIDTPGQPMGTEVCNNLDDDCDGVVDNNPANGDINSWVALASGASGVEIFMYEASRPDASATSAGNINIGKPCSKAGVRPWTNVKYPAAEAACASLGARVCTEADWTLACEGPAIASPRPQDPMGDQLVIIEAEFYDFRVAQGTPVHSWEISGAVSGYSRAGFMRAEPDVGTAVNGTQAPGNAPRLDYNVDFATTGTHYVWIRGLAPNASGNRVHMGIDGVVVGTEMGGFSSLNWEWEEVDGGNSVVTIDVPTPGSHTINVWMNEDGFMFDKLILTTNPAYVPTDYGPDEDAGGCTWSYGASCDTYQPDTCNGLDYDTDPGTAGNQDGPVPTGSLNACYTDWGAAGQVFDLSGNVKEWTYARTPGINGIRGGSYNNTSGGMTCQFDFTAANDDFLFPNVGFRCCRGGP